MKKQANEHPTSYRKAQAGIIEIHSALWRSTYWERLAQDVRTYQAQATVENEDE
jgi:hypothetical protein